MGTNPLLLLDELRELGACTVVARSAALPPLQELEAESCYLSWDVVLTTDRPRSAIEDVFIFVDDGSNVTIEPIQESDDLRLGPILAERGAIPRADIEEVVSKRPPIGELLVAAGKVTPEAVRSALAEQRHITRDRLAQAGASAANSRKSDSASIRVAADRLDELMDRVGELVIAQARLRELTLKTGESALKAVSEEIDRLASELRDTTMSIRMVPIGSLFGRFRRLVHDLGRDLGKPVRLITSGEETELDKTVIERLNDPLVHLIRNCIDHGLETTDLRRAAGKLEEGTVSLKAWHSGAQVIIEVSDDGRGLNREKILAKARSQGLIAETARLSEEEIDQLIFRPGFSTATAVTNVSGRGVGLDVVKRNIESLHGAIELSSREGIGMSVLVRLPLTLAIIDGLLVRVGTGQYVIPLGAVEECVELSVEDDARSTGRNLLNIRGELVPFLRLRDLFSAKGAPDPYQKAIIVSNGEQRVGLVVDQVIGDHQTVIKTLSRLHANVESFSGATILGDGTVALILDVEHLVNWAQAEEDRRKAG